MGKIVVAYSGGKDSTALALRLKERGEEISLLYTPTGNELPTMQAHIQGTADRIGAELILPWAPTLGQLIEAQTALPNWNQRWCTRMIKIQPCCAWMIEHSDCTLAVGLRADEEQRKGLYGEGFNYMYPMREWEWNIEDVRGYCKEKSVEIPERTDCAVCFFQRLGEWWRLWRNWPDQWRQGEEWEAWVSKERGRELTLRSPERDSWPAGMKGLRERFEAGDKPRGWDVEAPERRCRVCSM